MKNDSENVNVSLTFDFQKYCNQDLTPESTLLIDIHYVHKSFFFFFLHLLQFDSGAGGQLLEVVMQDGFFSPIPEWVSCS